MYPEVFEALMKLYKPGPGGKMQELVFHHNGKILEYRAIEHAYDRAFARAGLKFTGTHVMMHGG